MWQSGRRFCGFGLKKLILADNFLETIDAFAARVGTGESPVTWEQFAEVEEGKVAKVYGIRSPSGTRILDIDPFLEGREIPLATGEELFLYATPEDLNRATILRDMAIEGVTASESQFVGVRGLFGLLIGLVALTTAILVVLVVS